MIKTLNTASANRIAVWAITPHGTALAQRIAAGLPQAEVHAADRTDLAAAGATRFASLREAVAADFHRFSGHVFIMAAGIVVRTVAPLLIHKTRDPAVVVVDDRGRFVVSLLSGHIGGANRLAQEVADAIGAQPVVTTATDVNAVPAIDLLAVELGLTIENPQAIKAVNMALLTGAPVQVHDPYGLLRGRIPNAAELGGREDHPARVWVDDRLQEAPTGSLVLRPPSLAAGIGCNRRTAAAEIRRLLFGALQEARLSADSLVRLATIDLKAEEPGIVTLAQELGLPLEVFDRAQIGAVQDAVPTPSAAVEKHIGVKSVCEASAILAARGGSLIVPKRSTRNATVAIARINFSS